jgi:hypothetical protein
VGEQHIAGPTDTLANAGQSDVIDALGPIEENAAAFHIGGTNKRDTIVRKLVAPRSILAMVAIFDK